MSDLRTAAQMALVALDAEPQPVACDDESDCTHMPWCRIRKQCQRAAPTAQPLTDEQVASGMESHGIHGFGPRGTAFLDGVRFAERAHGIGGTP